MARLCVNDNNETSDLLRKLVFCDADTHVESRAVSSEDELHGNLQEDPKLGWGPRKMCLLAHLATAHPVCLVPKEQNQMDICAPRTRRGTGKITI